MKTKLLAVLAIAAVSALLAQGPLTPPGAPAPTMKTLDQIEPRKGINAVNTPGDADSILNCYGVGNIGVSAYTAENCIGNGSNKGVDASEIANRLPWLQ